MSPEAPLFSWVVTQLSLPLKTCSSILIDYGCRFISLITLNRLETWAKCFFYITLSKHYAFVHFSVDCQLVSFSWTWRNFPGLSQNYSARSVCSPVIKVVFTCVEIGSALDFINPKYRYAWERKNICNCSLPTAVKPAALQHTPQLPLTWASLQCLQPACWIQ